MDEREGQPGDSVAIQRVRAHGHEHVTAEHGSTLELTAEDWLTPAGDCIVGVEADRTPSEFDPRFRAAAAADVVLTATISVDADCAPQTIVGRGDPTLSFASDRSLVIRSSEYVDDRTVMVGADHAAADLDRRLVTALSRGAPCQLTLRVGPLDAELS